MNRLEFLKKLGIGLTALAVAPDLILPKEQKELTGFKFVNGSRQWSAGAIYTQRECIITDAYTLYVDAPEKGTFKQLS